jgi:hypothetical protein
MSEPPSDGLEIRPTGSSDPSAFIGWGVAVGRISNPPEAVVASEVDTRRGKLRIKRKVVKNGALWPMRYAAETATL